MHYRSPLSVLLSDGLGVGFAVGIEEFLAALLPRRLEFGRCDVLARTVPTAAKAAIRPPIFFNVQRRPLGFGSGAPGLGTSISVLGSSVVMG
jgi:hypothetical protein